MHQIEAVFRLKKMFSSNDKLAHWAIKLSMIRNDMYYVHRSLISIDEVGHGLQSGEMTYFFRLAASHYREAAKYINDNKHHDKIIEFINLLDKNANVNYEKILQSCTPWNNSFVKEVLKPVRDNFFHYTSEDFEGDFSALDDFYTRLTSFGFSRKEQNLVYADEVSLKLAFGKISIEKFRETLTLLSEYMVALIQFVDSAVWRFFEIRKEQISFYVKTMK